MLTILNILLCLQFLYASNSLATIRTKSILKEKSGSLTKFIVKLENEEIILNTFKDGFYDVPMDVELSSKMGENIYTDFNCHYVGKVEGDESSNVKLSDCKGLVGKIYMRNKSYSIKPVDSEMETTLESYHILTEEQFDEKNYKKDMDTFELLKQKLIPEDDDSQIDSVFRGQLTQTRTAKMSVIISRSVYMNTKFCNQDPAVCLNNLKEIILLTESVSKELQVIPLLMKVLIFDEEHMLDVFEDNSTILTVSLRAQQIRNILGDKAYDITTYIIPSNTVLGEVSNSFFGALCFIQSINFFSVDDDNQVNAAVFAHEFGSVSGLRNSDGNFDPDCSCTPFCVMSIVNIRRPISMKTFSKCDKEIIEDRIQDVINHCFLIFPNQRPLSTVYCGNGIIEEGEDCDCGFLHQCNNSPDFQCCDPTNCKFRGTSNCISGSCCNSCQIQRSGTACTSEDRECREGVCDGVNIGCIANEMSRDGTSCTNNGDVCFFGRCIKRNEQCQNYFDKDFVVSIDSCFNNFNIRGDFLGNCGPSNINGQGFRRCEMENTLCGKVLCRDELRRDQNYSYDSRGFTCIVPFQTLNAENFEEFGTVEDGTMCGQNKICIKNKCVNTDDARNVYMRRVCGANSFIDANLTCACISDAEKIDQHCFFKSRFPDYAIYIICALFGIGGAVVAIGTLIILCLGSKNRF